MKILETTTNMEAERGVLGCCLLKPQIRVFEVFDAFASNAVELFTHPHHRKVWMALLEVIDGGTAVDLLQVSMVLKKRTDETETTPEEGWVPFMMSLEDIVPSDENLPFYMDAAESAYMARKAGALFTKYIEKIAAETDNVKKLLGQFEAELMDINHVSQQKELYKLSELLPVIQEQLENYKRGGAQMTGISTGYGYLDKLCCGMRGGEMIVVCGRPGEGKTAFGMNVAANVALGRATGSNGNLVQVDPLPVLIFSMEMSALELARRVVFAEAEQDMQQWRTGFSDGEALPDISDTLQIMEGVPMYIDQRPALSIDEVRRRARQAKLSIGSIGLIVVDYLQLAKGEEGKNRQYSREQEVASVSRGIKQMAKELDVPVIACAQLNRNTAQSKMQKPSLADLRESGQIEQDADMVCALYPLPETEETAQQQRHWSKYETRVDLLVLKQRGGPQGHAEFRFKKDCVRFYEHYRSDEEIAIEEGIAK